MNNPFQNTSLLNQALSIEICQQIYFDAARSALPDTVDPDGMLIGLHTLARRYGSELYIVHPAHIEKLFRGVTLAVYQEIRHLFCTPLYRTHRIVWRIFDTLTREAQADIPSPEAVW